MEYAPPTDQETELLFEKVIAELQSEFDYVPEEAKALVDEFRLNFASQRRIDGSPMFEVEWMHHQGAHSLALYVQYYVKLQMKLDDSAFLNWRREHYAERSEHWTGVLAARKSQQ